MSVVSLISVVFLVSAVSQVSVVSLVSIVFLPLHVHVVLYKKYDSVIELGACCRHFGRSKGNLNSQLVDSNIITTPSTITGTVGIALRTCICSCTTYFYNSGIPHILHCR